VINKTNQQEGRQMLTRLRARIGSAHVIATIALFFAIAGGSAIALKGKNSVDSGDLKKNSVTAAKIKKNAVTAAKIKKSAVNSAKIKDGTVGTADIKDGNVTTADLAGPQPFHRVGAPGEPPFSNGGQNDCIWSKLTAPPLDPLSNPGFYKDPFGQVHLTGAFTSTDGPGGDGACDTDDVGDETLFILPPDYRPEALLVMSAPVFDGNMAPIDPGEVAIVGTQDISVGSTVLFPAGSVIANGAGGPPDGAQASIDGIDFRAASGAAGARKGTIHVHGAAARFLLRLAK
jgi:hypothetical protein